MSSLLDPLRDRPLSRRQETHLGRGGRGAAPLDDRQGEGYVART